MDWYEMTWPPDAADGRVDVTDPGGKAERLLAAAALTVFAVTGGGVCVPDVYALARALAGDDAAGSAARGLCALAADNRVLCRASARRLGCGSGRAAELLDSLAVPGGLMDVVARHGLGGAFAATRGAIALGAASAVGLALDPRTVHEAVDACRRVADERFAALIAHPDAARMFRDEGRTIADDRGFRPTRPTEMRGWLGDQLVTVTDRLCLPVPVVRHGEIDIQVRYWPLWAVGTDPLAALADLQDAEHLGHALRSVGGTPGRVRPGYPNPLAPVSTGPDLGAYRRLRAAGLPRCFVPAKGVVFVRIDLSELPLALLCAPPTGDLTKELASAVGVTPTVDQTNALAALASAGASDATVAVGVGRLAGLTVTRDQAGRLVRALVAGVPALAAHLRDPTPDRLAGHTRVPAAELAAWTGHTPPAPGGEGSLLRAFLASEQLSDAFVIIYPDHEKRLTRLRQRGVTPPTGMVPGNVIDHRRRDYRFLERERVVTRTGRVIACDTWVEARAALAASAHEVVLGVAFALVAAGHRVVGVTSTEILVERPADEVACDAIGATVAAAVTGFGVGGGWIPPPEAVERW